MTATNIQPVYALVDCNNFYASCERIFNPALNNKPLVVLSNNDGCIVARSNEAKALGITMGAPFYQLRALFQRHQVQVFSSNYTLYGDISQRVMASLRLLCPEVEVYSIDEAFLRFDGFAPGELQSYAENLREKIHTWVGIPVSIGIAPTKTLAKVANRIAKSQATSGICDLRNPRLQKSILQTFPIKDIWGIGSHTTAKLQQLGITTAQQLRDYCPKAIRQQFGVVVERIVLELRGFACLTLEKVLPKKNIISSRSFGKLITDYDDLAEAVSHHATRAAAKLRKQQSKAQGIYTFVSTNPFRNAEPQYQNGKIQGLVVPTADSSTLVKAAKNALKQIFRPGYQYYRAGIMLMDITSMECQQQDLFIDHSAIQLKREKLMQVMDQLNRQMGSNTVFLAAQGVDNAWKMRADRRSPRFTTDWGELVRVIA